MELFDEKGRLTDEAVAYAKNVPIVEYLEEQGFMMTRQGNSKYYNLDDHDSFVVDAEQNMYFWNSRQRGGNIINLLQDEELFGMKFREAVIELNSKNNQRIQSDHGMHWRNEKEKEPYAFPVDNMVKDPSRVREYLINDRKLNPDIVNTLMSKGFIRQDERNNAVYTWVNNGEIVGHNSEGSYKKKDGGRYKHIASGANQKFGFSFKTSPNKDIRNIYFFESEVDAISYASLNGLTPNSKYVSMRGVNNPSIIYQQILEVGQNTGKIPNVVYAVDNDEAGLKFNQDKIENNLVHREHGEMPIFFAVPPKKENVKDWNDELVRRNGHAYQEHEKNIPLSKKQYLQNYRHRESSREMEIE